MTIIEAIKKVMREQGAPMTYAEAYDAIISKNLYEFHADNPAGIVRSQIRRHCEGIDYPSSGATKHFVLVEGNKYLPLDEPKKGGSKRRSKRLKPIKAEMLSKSLRELKELQARYVMALKERVLSELKRLSPGAFEAFAKRLMEEYGFHAMTVTQISGDGGIDGHGKLKVGLADLNVAFQCKRWSKGNIQRPEVDKFRGATQGDFEMGIFFTTTSFSEGAIGATIKKGAVPIVLVDGKAIVTLMIEKGFGIQVDSLPVPSYALDLAIGNEASALVQRTTG